MAVTDPNPSSNPGMELECVNCRGMGVETRFIWHVPEGGGPTNLGTEAGGFNDYDSSSSGEPNKLHPHCPVCGSHAVDIIRTIDPT